MQKNWFDPSLFNKQNLHVDLFHFLFIQKLDLLKTLNSNTPCEIQQTINTVSFVDSMNESLCLHIRSTVNLVWKWMVNIRLTASVSVCCSMDFIYKWIILCISYLRLSILQYFQFLILSVVNPRWVKYMYIVLQIFVNLSQMLIFAFVWVKWPFYRVE